MDIIGVIIAGIIIGLLGKFVAPGDKDNIPLWLTLAAAGFFGVIALLTLLRAEKSVANGALTVITLLSVAVALAATIPGFGAQGSIVSGNTRSASPTLAAQAPLACLDDLAGGLGGALRVSAQAPVHQ